MARVSNRVILKEILNIIEKYLDVFDKCENMINEINLPENEFYEIRKDIRAKKSEMQNYFKKMNSKVNGKWKGRITNEDIKKIGQLIENDWLDEVLKNIEELKKKADTSSMKSRNVKSMQNKPAQNTVTKKGRGNTEKKQRIDQRKKQVKEDIRQVISLIDSGKWKFSDAKRLKTSGFIWECKDADGIKIRGVAHMNSVEIQIIFPNETIDIKHRYCLELEDAVLDLETAIELESWRKDKEIDKRIALNRNSNVRMETSARPGWKSCAYCGKVSREIVCDSCKRKHSAENRRGVGGYPSFDPMASGSNGTDYFKYSKKK